MKQIYVFGGGTMSHVRNHLSLAAPAYGGTARTIAAELERQTGNYQVQLVLTKMANPDSTLVTNEDVSQLLDRLLQEESTAGIVFNCAMADWEAEEALGSHGRRLETRLENPVLTLRPAEKVIGKIRKTRKDVFAVGFKTTTEADQREQYMKGLRLLKENSLNLVLANDVVTRRNMIVVPEEAQYMVGEPRGLVLQALVRMMLSRMQGHFTRSTVISGPPVGWQSTEIAPSLRTVVEHCIKAGAYKPVFGKTVGHFAARGCLPGEFITSARKSDFNRLPDEGMIRITSTNSDSVVAQGRKPSVGGMSQRIIFDEHPDVDCIVHFHCPVVVGKPGGVDIPWRSQWEHECGSHECGQNTSNGLKRFDLGDGDYLKAVYLDHHGPNLAFPADTDPAKVVNFINSNFALYDKTGGLVMDT